VRRRPSHPARRDPRRVRCAHDGRGASAPIGGAGITGGVPHARSGRSHRLVALGGAAIVVLRGVIRRVGTRADSACVAARALPAKRDPGARRTGACLPIRSREVELAGGRGTAPLGHAWRHGPAKRRPRPKCRGGDRLAKRPDVAAGGVVSAAGECRVGRGPVSGIRGPVSYRMPPRCGVMNGSGPGVAGSDRLQRRGQAWIVEPAASGEASGQTVPCITSRCVDIR